MFKQISINPYYSIDENGNVRNDKRGTFVKQWISKQGKGYYSVSLYIGHKKQGNFGVHRLLAQAFIPNPHKYSEVNHIDGDTRNNSLENLEWCSHKQNIECAVKDTKVFDAYRIHTTKIKKQIKQIDIITGDTVAIYESIREASRKTQIASSNIVKVLEGEQKRTKTYTWKYCYAEGE